MVNLAALTGSHFHCLLLMAHKYQEKLEFFGSVFMQICINCAK